MPALENRIVVPMGEYAVGCEPSVLVTGNIGSCVGIAIYDAHIRSGGLAHVAFPGMGKDCPRANAHADVAIEAIVMELENMDGIRAFMVAKIAGGSNMFGFEVAPEMDIGARNVATVRSILTKNRIPLVAEDVSEDLSRSMTLDLRNGKVVINSLGVVHREM